jgi:hypothetical protein
MSGEHVKAKLVLVDRLDPARAGDAPRSWESECGVSVSVTDLKPEFVRPGPTGQFVQGLHCERCDLGYLPESIAKPSRLRYRAVEGGWRRSNADGTLEPLLQRIAENPQSSDDPAGHIENPAPDIAGFDEVEATRAAYALQQRHGLGGHIVAAKWANGAEASGDQEAAEFWRRVSSSIRPR